MSGLDEMNVKVEGLRATAESAYNAVPVLHEIRHALSKLASTGESTTIDLSSIPFASGDKTQLFEALGQGEVEATVDAMGPTRIRETAFPGVWLVQYFAPEGEEMAAQIEITRLPSLLVTPEEDVRDSMSALEAKLGTGTGKPPA